MSKRNENSTNAYAKCKPKPGLKGSNAAGWMPWNQSKPIRK